jgi:histidine triad (HIT) family protein|tara:strand:- start:31 stop:411 length:381 start_codon:yes stop_codon:yes gene_type:complete
MIIKGDLPGTFLWRDDRCVVFMSINPIAPGHALVVPRDEIDQWIDIPSDLREHLFGVAHEVAEAQKRAFGVERVGMIIAGFEVPHMHVHLIPANNLADLDFARAATSVEVSELEAAAELIKSALES